MPMMPQAPMMGATPTMGMMGAPQGGMMPPQQAPPPEEPDGSPLEHLRLAIEHAQAALVMEPDDADSQNLAKVVQGLYAILAARQKEQDQMLGNPGLARSLRRG